MALFGKKKEEEKAEKVSGLKIDIAKDGTELTVKLKGRIDTIAPISFLLTA